MPAVAAVAGMPLTLQSCSLNTSFLLDNSTGAFHLQQDPTLCIDAGAVANCSLPPTSGFPFCNPALAPAERAQDLSERMSVGELASFLGNENYGVPRLGVPRVGYGEALHGLLRNCVETPVSNSTGCPTSFPHLLLLGGTFNRSLWHSVAAAISDEARAYFNLVNRTSHLVSWVRGQPPAHCLPAQPLPHLPLLPPSPCTWSQKAPDINPYRDARWGRGQEVAGEDPLLLQEFIKQYAAGMQEGEDPRFIKFVSTAKHFSGEEEPHSPWLPAEVREGERETLTPALPLPLPLPPLPFFRL